MIKEKILKFLKGNFFVATIILIVAFLSWVNYTPNTWLIGWDSLHPEFDFFLNFKRIFFGVWREEQGLGALAAHAHMSELPRIIYLSLASLFLPLNFLRYSYFFLTLILGPLGIYFFLERVVFKDGQDFARKTASFLGGLFYLFNLGTLQHFYVPFEMFATQYAFLPWLFLFASLFLTDGKRKNLVLFSFFTFLAMPMVYAPALWYAYFISLALYALTFFFFNRKQVSLKRPLIILATTLVLNSFWLLPNLYFTASGAQNVTEAKINQLFSEKAFAQDLKYATLENTALLKGFLFDWQAYDQDRFVFLLSKWIKHLENPLVLALGYLLFGIVVIGAIISFTRKQNASLYLLPLFLFALIFLLHSQVPLNYIFAFLQNNSFFKEGLRFPWTKFSLIVVFCYSIFFSQTIFTTINFIKNKILAFVSLGFLATLLVIWMLPAFSGDLISPLRKIEFPAYYKEMYNWFDQQKEDSRIAYLPVPSFWGWEYRDWGFEGAGFIWFGLKQPVLVRDFDRWDPANENFYWEISYAIYSKDKKLFESVTQKYQINWLLVDKSIINPAFPRATFYDELEEMLENSNKIKLAQTFGKIKIYQVILENPVNNFVFLAQNLPNINPTYKWNNLDQAYLDSGNYISGEGLGASVQGKIYYPFRSLFTGRSQEELEFIVEDRGDFFVFKKTIPGEFQNYSLQIPEASEELIQVDSNDLSKINYFEPEVIFRDGVLEVIVPKITGYYSAQIDPSVDPQVQEAKNCNQFSPGEVKNEIISDSFLRLTSLNALNCSAAFWLPNLPHSLAYLITVESRNIAGKSLLFWLENLNIRKADIETYLPKNSKLETGNLKPEISNFIQPSMEKDGLGYSLHFDNFSIGQEKTVNDLGKITVNPIPYKLLTQLKLVPTTINQPLPISQPITDVSHPNPAFYEISQFLIPNSQFQYLVLSQAYHEGWQAYTINNQWSMINDKLGGVLSPIIGQRIKNHVLVNNWENGWELSTTNLDKNENKKIVLIFVPQYLEYFGLLLLLLSLFLIPLLTRKTKSLS